MKKYTSLSLTRYLAELSSNKPIPGGGSASAYVACLGMGLAEMAGQIGMKKVSGENKPAVQRAIRLLRKARKDALQIVDLDPRIYENVIKTYAQTRKIEDGVKKNRLVDESLENAFRLQADLALLVSMAKRAACSLTESIQGSIANDLRLSQRILDAAFYGAFETARINVVYLKDPRKKLRGEQALEELKKRFESENVEVGHAAGASR